MADGKQGAQDAWRAYLELALGVTEASKKKAQKVAKRLAGRGGTTAQQLQSLADNLVSTSLANREALTKLVRFEVDRALGAVGLATADEVADLQSRIGDLERQLRQEQALGESAAVGAGAPAVPVKKPPVPAKKAVARKAVTKKTVAKAGPTRAVAKKATAGPAGAATQPAPDAGTGPAAGAAAGQAKKVAKKAVAKKAPARKVTPPAGMAPE
jgi:polyhydroxyalkanoate synthesis regulator phasin